LFIDDSKSDREYLWDEQHLPDTAPRERGLRRAGVLKFLALAARDRHPAGDYSIGDAGGDRPGLASR
jgi:hypothetical protein